MRYQSPKHKAFLEKIYKDSEKALLSELQANPYNQTNKIFLAKALYGYVEKTEPKQIEVHHDIKNYGSLPMFGESET